MKIYYIAGVKYQLARKVRVKTSIKGYRVHGHFYDLYEDGLLEIRKGYGWDGPSGPTRDTKNSLPGSLVHDVLYEMMRKGLLPRRLRKLVDKEFHRLLLSDGMWKLRADTWYYAVRIGARGAASSKARKKILVAP